MISWHVIQSKPQKEGMVWEQLRLRNIDVFFPRIRVQPVNPRARRTKPYFPRYLFVHSDLEQNGLSDLRWIPGAIGLVLFGGEPAIVPENLVHAIRERVEQINAACGEQLEGMKQAEPVVIQDGPFAGYEAIFDAYLPGSQRVRVLVGLLQKRRVPIYLPAGQIQRKKQH